MIAISEGIRTADGRYVCELAGEGASHDVFGHKNLTGAGKFLANVIADRIGCKTRAIELNTLQRCSAHVASRTDITEAYQAGGAATMAAVRDEETAKMVILKRLSTKPYLCVTDLADIDQIANREKMFPREWIAADGFGVTPEFVQYVYPLIQAELTPVYIGGLPRHIALN